LCFSHPRHLSPMAKNAYASPGTMHFPMRAAGNGRVTATVAGKAAVTKAAVTVAGVKAVERKATTTGIPGPKKGNNNKKEVSSSPCRFFLMARGCREGKDCRFVHDTAARDAAKRPCGNPACLLKNMCLGRFCSMDCEERVNAEQGKSRCRNNALFGRVLRVVLRALDARGV
jgi:hypothetical protein